MRQLLPTHYSTRQSTPAGQGPYNRTVETIIQNIAIFVVPVLLAITLHEAAHGYVAKLYGDATAFMLGRVTLNPAKHIDPVGTIILPLVIGFVTNWSFLFGYAKPVPVNASNLRNPRRDMALVALAGPVSNYIQALIWALLYVLMAGIGIDERYFLEVAKAGVLVNIIMAVFNLFPLPPLDGGRVLASLVPARYAELLDRIEPYGFFIVMALVLTHVITDIWMRPLMAASYTVINTFVAPLRALLS
jgi:Zn-dependent protease